MRTTMNSTKRTTHESSKSAAASGKKSTVFTDEEKASMRESAREMKATAADGKRFASMVFQDRLPLQ